jgi:hypothetical protein
MGAGIGWAGARLGTGNLVSDFTLKVMAFRCQRRPEGSRRRKLSSGLPLNFGFRVLFLPSNDLCMAQGGHQ